MSLLSALTRRVDFTLPLLLLIHTPLFAQAPARGPDFERGGFNIVQLNDGDSRFHPYVLHRKWSYDYDKPEREHLVDTKITVDAEGRVTKVETLGGFYDDTFLQEAINGLEGSMFKPATQDGANVEWTQLDVRVILRGPFTAGTDEAIRADFVKLLDMMKAEQYAEAETFAKELMAGKIQRLFEYAYLQDQLASIYMATDRPHEALEATRKATGITKPEVPFARPDSRINRGDNAYPDEFLTIELYVQAMRKRLLVALASNQTGEALQVFDLIKEKTAVTHDDALIAELQPRIDELKQSLASAEPLGSQAKLIDGVWSFPLSTRRIVGATALQGKVDFMDVNCTNATKRRLPFANDSEWQIPASWGQCTLEFRGDSDSQFTLYEFSE